MTKRSTGRRTPTPDARIREPSALERLRARQTAGELPPDLDLASLQLAITGMVVAR